MKVAIYPGSFNPFHRGHLDIVNKALDIFDKVIIAKGSNPEKVKKDNRFWSTNDCIEIQDLIDGDYVEIEDFNGLLVDFVSGIQAEFDSFYEIAIIKGLRNGQDLEDEKAQLYWNEDLGLLVPFFYIISDRNNCHISSSAIRGLEKFKEIKDG